MTMRNWATFCVLSSLVSTVPLGSFGEANAAIIIDIQEVGLDVVATTAGTLDPTGLILVGGQPLPAFMRPATAVFSANAPGVFLFSGLSGPSSFGPGFESNGTGVGDAFLVAGDAGLVGLSLFFVAGAPLAATTTFSGQTFATLGVTPGAYVFSVPADTITINIGALSGAIPEPSTWAMMLLGLGLVGGTMRSARRRPKLSAPTPDRSTHIDARRSR